MSKNAVCMLTILAVSAGPVLADPPPIAITEWMYAGGNGEFIELTNISDTPVDMTGWSYSDDAREPGIFDLSVFGWVQPGESVIIAEISEIEFRTAWGIAPAVKIIGDLGNPIGENLGRNDEINLYDSMGMLVDRLTYGDQAFPGSVRTQTRSGNPTAFSVLGTDDPYGWVLASAGDDFGSWLSTAGDAGNPGVLNIPVIVDPPAGPVTPSHDAGFYTDGFTLTLDANEGDIIRYTLDGTIPTQDSPEYTVPFAIGSRAGHPNVLSLIPTSAEGWRTPTGIIKKINTVRARAFRPSGDPGPLLTRTFIVDPEGADRYSMPVVSLVFEQNDLFGYEQGIYVPGLIYDQNFDPNIGICQRPANYNERGDEWERPSHIEFFEPDGSLGFQADIGLRIHGGCSRRFPRKSLRVYFRGEYGQPWLGYPIFPDDSVVDFKRFTIRNSGNDWDLSLFRDAMIHHMIKDTGVAHQSSRPVIVFLNGEYWGIHNIRDRIDKYYLETRKGVDPDNIDMLGRDIGGSPEVIEGEADDFVAIRNFIFSNSMANTANYELVADQIDIQNMISYYAIQLFISNRDWPHNNITFWRERLPESKWRWILFDTDLSFNYSGSPPTRNSISNIRSSNQPNGRIFNRLLDNPVYRREFINQTADYMNTIFTTENMLTVIEQFKDVYRPEIPEHAVRWRDPSVNSWENTRAGSVLYAFANERPALHWQHMVAGFGNISGLTALTVQQPTPSQGLVQVNSIHLSESDSTWSGIYFRGVPVPLRGIAKPGYAFEGFLELSDIPNEQGIVWWTPDEDITLTPIFSLAPSMSITEWMYAGSTLAGGEFVEFTNMSDSPVDMTNWSFDDDARAPGVFDLSAFGIVQPGESVILTEDSAEDFRTIWNLGSQVKVVGNLGNPDGNNLGRNDEINLYNSAGLLVDRLTYGDQAFPGSIRTQRVSGNPISLAVLGTNDPHGWILSSVDDAFESRLSTTGDVGNPGRFTLLDKPSSCPGDIADDFGLTAAEGGGPDGIVDFGDFAALLGLIGPCDPGTPGCLGDIADDFGLTADEEGGPDGFVDFGDFAALLGLIGPCP